MKPLLPANAPDKSEEWDTILQDFKDKILPGVTHWQHPRFHAYFPAGNSYPSILGELLSAGLGTVGFSWAASPSCTELETIVLDWLGRMLNLPKALLPEANDKYQPTQTDINGNCNVSNLNNQNEIQKSQFKGGGVILVIYNLFLFFYQFKIIF